MSETQTQTQTGNVKVIIAGNEYELPRNKDEIVEFVIQKARELGWRRFDVYADGELVSPNEADKLETANTIEVVKADVAG